MKTIIKNIKEILCITNKGEDSFKKGKEMNTLNSLKDGWISIEYEKIKDFGSMDNWPGVDDWNETTIIDAKCLFSSYNFLKVVLSIKSQSRSIPKPGLLGCIALAFSILISSFKPKLK